MKKGFTLVELLIVIAIIGILASIVVVSLSNTTGDAQEKKSRYNVAQAARGLVAKKAQDSANAYDCDAVGVAASTTASTIVGALGCNEDGDDPSAKFIVYERFLNTSGSSYFCADSVNQTPRKAAVGDDEVGTDVECP